MSSANPSQQKSEALDAWVDHATDSELTPIMRFARAWRRDITALVQWPFREDTLLDETAFELNVHPKWRLSGNFVPTADGQLSPPELPVD